MRKILLLVTLLLIASFAFAQIPGNIGSNNDRMSINKYGIKGGINFSNIYGADVEDSKMKFSFIGGAFYDFPVNSQFSIQPEVLFSMKGWRFVESEDDYEFWGKINYIEIPILGKIKLNNISNIKPALYFGPCFGFNVSARYRVDYDGDEHRGPLSDLFDMNGFEFSLGLGLLLEEDGALFDFRYSIGLTSIDTDNEYDPVKNSVISLMFGFKL